jgi:hypothetical protein
MQAVRIFNKGCGRDRRGFAIVTALDVNRKTSRRTELTNRNAAIHLPLAQYARPRISALGEPHHHPTPSVSSGRVYSPFSLAVLPVS